MPLSRKVVGFLKMGEDVPFVQHVVGIQVFSVLIVPLGCLHLQ